MDRARKVDANLLLQKKGSKDGIVYRRVEEKRNRRGGTLKALIVIVLPSDDEIATEIKKCIPVALRKINDLGIKLTGKDPVNFSFSSKYGNKIRINTICQDDLEDDDEEDEQPGDDDDCHETEAEQDPYDLEVLRSLQHADLRDFTDIFKDLSTSSFAFVQLADAEGNLRLVQIKTLCWFLETQMKKMSNDRNLKVRQLLSFPEAQKLLVKKVEESKIVRIGDWCLFQTLSGSKRDYLFLLGRVLQFKSFFGSKQKTLFEWQRGNDKKQD